MSMAEQLSENSRQGFAALKPPYIGGRTGLSRNLRWGCSHVYDETPVGIAVYVRNDPVNLIDPDGRMWGPTSELQYLISMGWNTYDAANMLYALPNIGGSNPYWGNMNPSYFMYMMAQAEFNAYQYQLYLLQQSGMGSQAVGAVQGGYLSVSNASKSGPKQERIMQIVGVVAAIADDTCANWLISGSGSKFNNDLNALVQDAFPLIGHADLGNNSLNAVVNPNPSQTNLPPDYLITINDFGSFFANNGVLVAGAYTGGSSQAQVAIILHELAHFFKAPGIVGDYGNQNLVRQNDNTVSQHCSKTLQTASAIPN